MWPLDPIADAALDALRARDAALREEQAVYGLDAQQELSFHPLIADGLRAAGLGVLREQPFPHEWTRKLRPRPPKGGPLVPSGRSSSLGGPLVPSGSSLSLGAPLVPSGSSSFSSESDPLSLALPLPRDRQRCDFVLTPEPGQTLDDSLHTEKQRRAEEAEVQGTLFESLASSHLAPGFPLPNSDVAPPTSAIPPESAFWLELKVCGQYTNTSGIPGPNRTYTSDLTRAPLADLKKLAEDSRIVHAGVLLIVFTESEAVAKHDIAILAHRVLDRDWPISTPVLRTFPISDRIGNAACTVCLIGMR